LGTTGPMPVRDWAGAAAGSSKAAVRRTVHRRRHRRERGEGGSSCGLRVMGMGGRHALTVQRCQDMTEIGIWRFIHKRKMLSIEEQ
jgi:hypothetical protein